MNPTHFAAAGSCVPTCGASRQGFCGARRRLLASPAASSHLKPSTSLNGSNRPPLTASKQAKARELHGGDKNGSHRGGQGCPLSHVVPTSWELNYITVSKVSKGPTLWLLERTTQTLLKNMVGPLPRTELAASRLSAEDRSALIWDAAASGSRAERPGAGPLERSGLLAAFLPTWAQGCARALCRKSRVWLWLENTGLTAGREVTSVWTQVLCWLILAK